MSENQELDKQHLEAGEGMSAEKIKNLKATSKRLFTQLFEQKIKLITALFSIIASRGFMLAAPLVIGYAINEIVNGIATSAQSGIPFHVNIDTMGSLFALLLGLYILNALFVYVVQYVMADVSQNLALSMRKSLNAKLSHLPLRYYDQHQKGEILSRVTNDVEKIATTLQEGMVQLISAVVTLVGTMILMIWINPILTLIFIVTIALSGILTTIITKKSQAIFAENQATLGKLNGQIEEYFTGHAVIKLFNKQSDTIESVIATNNELYQTTKKAQFISYVINHFVRFLNNIGYVAIAVTGAVFAYNGLLSLGILQAYFQYVVQASEPVTEVSYVINNMQAAIAAAERVYAVLDETEEPADSSPALQVENPIGKVTFKNVDFGYSTDKPLLQDVNFTVTPGQKVAIVGPTGAGKTTLVNLLMRFYDVDGGEILIDDVPIRAMTREHLRSLLGMVLQDTWLFNGSIADNIAYGHEGATRDEIMEAAVVANADHFIRTLSKGYDTALEDDAGNVSAGQKQLLTIARAFLADPPILILDEATSSVDTRTEVRIQKAMEVLMQGRTSFVIAHRLSTIQDADLILVMKQGKIIEQGNHQQLLEQNGFYFELYNSQFSS